MGTTSEKLTYLNGTKQKLKQAINNIGGEVTDETTFRQYANQLQNVYDNLPKTEYQEGTEVNLGVTSKGKLDYDNGVVGIGQSSQEGTPTPSTPIDINSVTGNQNVVVSGKNLFDKNNITFYASNNADFNGVDASNKVRERTSSIAIANVGIKTNTTYKISGLPTGWELLGIGTFTQENGSNTSQGSTINNTFIINDDNIKYIFYLFRNNSSTEVATDLFNNANIQVEEGSTATPYEPYITPTSYQLSLGDIQLNAIGNYKDELIYDVENDRVYKNEKIKEVILNSSYRTSGGTTGTNAYYIATSLSDGLNDNSNILAYSNMFKGISFDSRNGAPDSVMLQNGSVTLRTRNNTDIDWSDNAKRDAWLNANTPLVYYVLATPVEIPITDTILVNQVKALYNAHSLNGTTIITSNGELPMIIKVRGLKGE